MKKLEDFLMPTQKELFSKLCDRFKGRTTVCKNSYILFAERLRLCWWLTSTRFTRPL